MECPLYIEKLANKYGLISIVIKSYCIDFIFPEIDNFKFFVMKYIPREAVVGSNNGVVWLADRISFVEYNQRIECFSSTEYDIDLDQNKIEYRLEQLHSDYIYAKEVQKMEVVNEIFKI